jgi:hypothetical protein
MGSTVTKGGLHLLIMNTVFILALTAICMNYTYQLREKLTSMDGMRIAMIVGMMSGIALGMNFGVVFHDLSLSTIFSSGIGILCGYITGKPISLMAAVDGFIAGIMGGIMGPMTVAMLSDPFLLIWFVDFIFIIAMFLVFQLIKNAKEAFSAPRAE